LIYFSPEQFRDVPGWTSNSSGKDTVYHNAGPAFLLLQYPLQKIHYAITGHFSGGLFAVNALLFVVLGGVFLGLFSFRVLSANGFSFRAATLMAITAALVYQNFGANLGVVSDFHPPTAGANLMIVVTYLLYRYYTASDPSVRRRLRRATGVAFFTWACVDFVVIPLFFLMAWALALYLEFHHDSWRAMWLRNGLLPTLAAFMLFAAQLACGYFIANSEFVGSSILFRTGLDGNTYAESHAGILPLVYAPRTLRWWISLFPFAFPFYAFLLFYRFWWMPRQERNASRGLTVTGSTLKLEVDLVSILFALYVLYFSVFSQHVLIHSGLYTSTQVFTIHLFVPSVLIVFVVFPTLLKKVGVDAKAIAYACVVAGVTYVWVSWRLYAMELGRLSGV
jgi:hypothetical protein